MIVCLQNMLSWVPDWSGLGVDALKHIFGHTGMLDFCVSFVDVRYSQLGLRCS